MDINTATKVELIAAVVEQGLVEFQVEAEKMSVKDLRTLLSGGSIQAPEGTPAAAAPVAKTVKSKGGRVRLTIHEQEGPGGNDDVYVGVNGVGYQIKRGHEVEVPPEVVEVLNNAVATVFEPLKEGGMRERNVRRYNFTVQA